MDYKPGPWARAHGPGPGPGGRERREKGRIRYIWGRPPRPLRISSLLKLQSWFLKAWFFLRIFDVLKNKFRQKIFRKQIRFLGSGHRKENRGSMFLGRIFEIYLQDNLRKQFFETRKRVFRINEYWLVFPMLVFSQKRCPIKHNSRPDLISKGFVKHVQIWKQICIQCQRVVSSSSHRPACGWVRMSKTQH